MVKLEHPVKMWWQPPTGEWPPPLFSWWELEQSLVPGPRVGREVTSLGQCELKSIPVMDEFIGKSFYFHVHLYSKLKSHLTFSLILKRGNCSWVGGAVHTLMVISATEPSVMTWSRLCIALMGVLRPIKEGGFVQGRIASDRARFLASVPTPLYCRVLKTDCPSRKDALILNEGINRARPKKHSNWRPVTASLSSCQAYWLHLLCCILLVYLVYGCDVQ